MFSCKRSVVVGIREDAQIDNATDLVRNYSEITRIIRCVEEFIPLQLFPGETATS